jgi:hypothetical protein
MRARTFIHIWTAFPACAPSWPGFALEERTTSAIRQ